MRKIQLCALILALIGFQLKTFGDADKVWEKLLQRVHNYQSFKSISLVTTSDARENRFFGDMELLEKYALKGNLQAYQEFFAVIPFVDGYIAEGINDIVWELAQANPSLFVDLLRKQSPNAQKFVKDNLLNILEYSSVFREDIVKTAKEVRRLWEPYW